MSIYRSTLVLVVLPMLIEGERILRVTERTILTMNGRVVDNRYLSTLKEENVSQTENPKHLTEKSFAEGDMRQKEGNEHYHVFTENTAKSQQTLHQHKVNDRGKRRRNKSETRFLKSANSSVLRELLQKPFHGFFSSSAISWKAYGELNKISIAQTNKVNKEIASDLMLEEHKEMILPKKRKKAKHTKNEDHHQLKHYSKRSKMRYFHETTPNVFEEKRTIGDVNPPVKDSEIGLEKIFPKTQMQENVATNNNSQGEESTGFNIANFSNPYISSQLISSSKDDLQEVKENIGKTKSASTLTEDTSATILTIIGLVMITLMFLLITTGVSVSLLYKRRYLRKAESMDKSFVSCDSYSGSYADSETFNSVSYADCAGIEMPKDNSSEELYNLDNDSFLNSLETISFPEYWTEKL